MDIIDEAFMKIDRTNFVTPENRMSAAFDHPLPIGYGQTISQPSTVRSMLHWLDARQADRALDIGSGSGWTSALLSYIVGKAGHVYAVERISELLEFGEENVRRLDIMNVSFHMAEENYGLPEFAPYDRILVSASADSFPQELMTQLKPGGKLVIPIHDDILEIFKETDTKSKIKNHPGFVFVPLI